MTDKYDYKIEQLHAMLDIELGMGKNGKDDAGYGANLSHWYGNSKPIQLDAKALRGLIRHYKGRSIEEE